MYIYAYTGWPRKRSLFFFANIFKDNNNWLFILKDTANKTCRNCLTPKWMLQSNFQCSKGQKILESYFSTKSVVLTQREFRREFPARKTPCRKTITKIVEKFRNTGSVRNDNKRHSGRYVAVRTRANVQAVRKHLEQSPRKSTRRLSQEVGISRTTVQRIIHNDLKLFPYKVQILQKQTDVNKEERSEFCQTISERIENNPGDLGLILFSPF